MGMINHFCLGVYLEVRLRFSGAGTISRSGLVKRFVLVMCTCIALRVDSAPVLRS